MGVNLVQLKGAFLEKQKKHNFLIQTTIKNRYFEKKMDQNDGFQIEQISLIYNIV
jgi:hypothetical protein